MSILQWHWALSTLLKPKFKSCTVWEKLQASLFWCDYKWIIKFLIYWSFSHGMPKIIQFTNSLHSSISLCHKTAKCMCIEIIMKMLTIRCYEQIPVTYVWRVFKNSLIIAKWNVKKINFHQNKQKYDNSAEFPLSIDTF